MLKRWWTYTNEGLEQLAPFFCCHLTTQARLNLSNPPESVRLTEDPLRHPIHYMQIDDSIEAAMSSYFRRAFGLDLVVHRNAGKEVPLLCGERPKMRSGEDRVSLSYIKELEKLPSLHTQGDGMRSFAGVLLYALIVDHKTVLIDEPEAFLHPPQARLIGNMLAREARNRQLIVGTHSGDFLRGLLDAEASNVRVIRLRRQGEINIVSELKKERVQELWRDPLLRYSNLLDGLFHEQVVVCESDADCKFYAAMLDALYEVRPEERKPDVMFVHCGGKDRIPTVVRALRAVGVPIAAIADFDVLNDQKPLKEIVEGLGGEWAKIEGDWRAVKTAIEARKPELNTGEVRKEIEKELSSIRAAIFPEAAVECIQKILRRSNPWATAKGVGLAYVPSGLPSGTCARLLATLRSNNLFVVEFGEVEGFARTVGGHGPAWVNSVLSRKNLSTDPELTAARQFAEAVVSSASIRPRV